MNDNTVVKGMVWMPFTDVVISGLGYINPKEDKFQSRVLFIPTKEFEGLKKVKAKSFTKYEPGEIKGYGIGDHRLMAVQYADNSALGFNMLNKKYFFQVVAEGKINLYRQYKVEPDGYTRNVLENNDGADGVNSPANLIGTYYQLLIQKDGGKLKSTDSVNMKELLGDCDLVYGKYLSGGYGYVPKDDGEKKGFLKKALSKNIDRDGLIDALPTIVSEYNEKMGTAVQSHEAEPKATNDDEPEAEEPEGMN